METLKFKNIRINGKIVEITIQKTFPNSMITIDSYLGKQKYLTLNLKDCISRYKRTYSNY